MSLVHNKPKLILSMHDFGSVSQLAERGQLTKLKSFILAGRETESFGNKLVEEEEHTSGELGIIRSRPVIKAVQNGHQPVVGYLLSTFSDIVCSNSSGRYPHSTRDSTALHSAAEKGHVGILKLLVESSADVNCRDTRTGWTPLHAAISSGQEDAIEYLTSCQADVNAADTNGKTPLQEVIVRHASSVYGKNCAWLFRVVEMLLKSEASIRQAAHNGHTVFHYIALCNNDTSQQVLKVLIKNNPQLAWTVLQMPSKGRNYTELPAILFAAEWRNERFIEFITSQPECSPTIAADALLALSTYQNTHYKIILKLWEKAFNKYGQGYLVEYLPSDYGNRVEICSLDKAHQLIIVTNESNDFTDLHYQFLIMRERIFGTGSRATIEYLWKLGHQMCEKKCFAEAEQLYTKALKMMLLNITGEYSQPGCYTYKSYLYTRLQTEFTGQKFQKLVTQMLSNGYKPNFFQLVSYGLEIIKHEHSLTTDTLHQLFSLLGAWAYAEWKTTGCLINEIEKLGCEMVNSFSFLQLLSFSYGCSSEPLYILPEEHDEYVSFMVDGLFYWEAGSLAINAVDRNGNRPLHVVATQTSMNVTSRCMHTAETEINFASVLVDNGTHLDAVNSRGKTAYEICSNPEIKAIIAPPKPLPLACLASRAVVAEDIPYNELTCIPSHIKPFVAFHDCSANRDNFQHRI